MLYPLSGGGGALSYRGRVPLSPYPFHPNHLNLFHLHHLFFLPTPSGLGGGTSGGVSPHLRGGHNLIHLHRLKIFFLFFFGLKEKKRSFLPDEAQTERNVEIIYHSTIPVSPIMSLKTRQTSQTEKNSNLVSCICLENRSTQKFIHAKMLKSMPHMCTDTGACTHPQWSNT